MEFIFLYLGFLALWLGFVIGAALWIVKRVVPGIVEEMDKQGLNDIQKQLVLNKAVFPPRFHR